MKRTISETVKGLSRADWCRQIGKLPKKITPEHRLKLVERAKVARQAQRDKNGALFGRKNQKVIEARERVTMAVNRFAGLDRFRDYDEAI